jgi:hypothetical protein
MLAARNEVVIDFESYFGREGVPSSASRAMLVEDEGVFVIVMCLELLEDWAFI